MDGSRLRERLTVLVGERVARKILREFSQQVVRFPVAARRNQDARDLAIIALLEVESSRRPGRTPTYDEVARAFGVTKRHVVRIAKRPLG